MKGGVITPFHTMQIWIIMVDVILWNKHTTIRKAEVTPRKTDRYLFMTTKLNINQIIKKVMNECQDVIEVKNI